MSRRCALVAAVLVGCAGCGASSGGSSTVAADPSTVPGAFEALRRAAATHDALTACRLLIPVTDARPLQRQLLELVRRNQALELVARDTAACDASFGRGHEFDELSRGLAGVRIGSVSTLGVVATVTVTGPHTPAGSTASFIRLGGVWRMAFAPN